MAIASKILFMAKARLRGSWISSLSEVLTLLNGSFEASACKMRFIRDASCRVGLAGNCSAKSKPLPRNALPSSFHPTKDDQIPISSRHTPSYRCHVASCIPPPDVLLDGPDAYRCLCTKENLQAWMIPDLQAETFRSLQGTQNQ